MIFDLVEVFIIIQKIKKFQQKSLSTRKYYSISTIEKYIIWLKESLE